MLVTKWIPMHNELVGLLSKLKWWWVRHKRNGDRHFLFGWFEYIRMIWFNSTARERVHIILRLTIVRTHRMISVDNHDVSGRWWNVVSFTKFDNWLNWWKRECISYHLNIQVCTFPTGRERGECDWTSDTENGHDEITTLPRIHVKNNHYKCKIFNNIVKFHY